MCLGWGVHMEVDKISFELCGPIVGKNSARCRALGVTFLYKRRSAVVLWWFFEALKSRLQRSFVAQDARAARLEKHEGTE